MMPAQPQVRLAQGGAEGQERGHRRDQPPPSAGAQKITGRDEHFRDDGQFLPGVFENARDLWYDINDEADDHRAGDQRDQRLINECKQN
jgi:hypothetical protein